jgi:hypothetical protein
MPAIDFVIHVHVDDVLKHHSEINHSATFEAKIHGNRISATIENIDLDANKSPDAFWCDLGENLGLVMLQLSNAADSISLSIPQTDS